MAYETIPGAGEAGAFDPMVPRTALGGDTVELPLGEVTMSNDASQAVFARDLTMNDSAAATADADGGGARYAADKTCAVSATKQTRVRPPAEAASRSMTDTDTGKHSVRAD